MDSALGAAFWDIMPIDNCSPGKYTTLYSGPVTKITERGNEQRALFVIESHEVSCAFKDLGTVNLCSFQLIRTEHPKLFISDNSDDNLPSQKDMDVNNIYMFAYVNSKFVYTIKHFKGQMARLYHDVVKKQCELERRI